MMAMSFMMRVMQYRSLFENRESVTMGKIIVNTLQ